MREANPLTDDEVRRFKSAAREMPCGYRLVGHVLLETGLRPIEYRHLHRNWIEAPQSPSTDLRKAESIIIDVQGQTPCKGTVKFGSKNGCQEGPTLVERQESCRWCDSSDGWTPNSSASERRIPVIDTAAVETIGWWFDRHESIPTSTSAVTGRVKKIAKRAGVDNHSQATAMWLRDTYGVRLLRSGLDIDEVTRLMGYAGNRRLKPLFEHTDRAYPGQTRVRITDEELLEELQRLADAVNRAPKWREMDIRGAYSPMTYANRFGGWNGALRKAGLKTNHRSPEQASDEELLANLRRLADELDRPPTKSDLRENGSYSYNKYWRRLNGLERARELAGLDE